MGHNMLDAPKEAHVQVDQLRFHRLHGRHHEYTFDDA